MMIINLFVIRLAHNPSGVVAWTSSLCLDFVMADYSGWEGVEETAVTMVSDHLK